MRSAAVYLPALLRFSAEEARQDGWGRLTQLTPGGAELSTATRLRRGELVLLSFELGGERFRELRARVEHAEDDRDGRRLAEVRFLDQLQRRQLAKILADVLSRA